MCINRSEDLGCHLDPRHDTNAGYPQSKAPMISISQWPAMKQLYIHRLALVRTTLNRPLTLRFQSVASVRGG
jgi:hypothetical protein